MKVLIVHTYYKEGGGEDQVVENEIRLLSTSIKVVKSSYRNSGSLVTTALNFFFSFYNPWSALKMKMLIKKEKPDLIHLHNWYFAASPSVIRQAIKSKIPIVHTIHNYRLVCPSGTLFNNGHLFLDSLNGKFPWSAIKKAVYRDSIIQTFWLAFIIRIHHVSNTWRSIQKLIVLSSFAEQIYATSYLNLSKKQLVVKSNFVSDNGYAIENRKKHFLFVGRLVEYKGVKPMLGAFSESDLQLVIIGDGPMKDYVNEFSKLHPNICYLGKRPNLEILMQMKSCAALIFPSLLYEGMPMTILEAFSTGTPVLASNLGAMATLIKEGENGLLFEPGNQEDIILKIKQWSRLNASEMEMYCANARESYEANFTPAKNLEKLLKIYNEVLKQ